MKNKYYTPDISEFYVGFEYEGFYQDKWHKKILIVNDDDYPDFGELRHIEICINKNLIRIKYLDKDDIEKLGFIFDIARCKIKGNFGGFSKCEKYYISYCPYDFNLKEYNLKKLKIWGNDYPLKNGKFVQKILFEGIIKNKSELKKLLRQLDIIND